MTTNQSLSQSELDSLDQFLLSDAVSDEAMDVCALDGFLTAVALNPRMVLPSEWLPWVWDMAEGQAQPEFEDETQANEVLGWILRHYNSVIAILEAGGFEPIWAEFDAESGDDYEGVAGWCEGFMLGVAAFLDEWDPLMDNAVELVSPMMLLGTPEGWDLLDKHKNPQGAMRDAFESIPLAVEGIADYFAPARQAWLEGRMGVPMRREEPKVGRNELCPCGSGEKYKKCCGAPHSVQ